MVDSPFPILLHAEDGTILQASNSWCEISGYTREELATIADWTERAYGKRKILIQADIDRLYDLSHRLDEGDYKIRTKRGDTRIWDFSSAPLGRLPDGRRLVISMAMDVTERRQAEAAVRDSEERLGFALQKSYTGGWNLDLVDHTAHRTLEHDRIFGYQSLLPQWTYEMFLEHVLSEDRVEVDRLFREAIAAQTDWAFECRIRRADAEVRWIWAAGGHQRDGQGKARRMAGIVQDITERKRAETAIRDSETRYRSLFENMLNGLAYCRMLFDGDRPQDFVYLAVNQAFETLTGLKGVEGKKVSEVIPGIQEADPLLFEVCERVARTGVPERIETYVEALKMWVALAVYSPGKDHFVAVFDVITARKRAEEALHALNAELEQRVRERTAQLAVANAELHSLFESLPGLYLVLTPDLKIVAASDAYLKATLTTREGILGRNLFDVFPDNPDDSSTKAVANMQASIDRVLRNAASDTMAIARHDVRGPDGVFVERYWSPINSPMFGADREIKYIIHRVEEITEYVRQKSRPANNSPGFDARIEQKEAEVFQSVQKVRAANQQLEIANKELEAFSYSVSHDLRAPLRAIDGFSRILLEDYGDKLDDAGKDSFNRIRAASQRMGQLIDDLLQLSRHTRSEMRRTSVDLSALARAVVEELQKTNPERPVEFVIGPDLDAEADAGLMRVVLDNLLGNAWKFTGKQAAAKIEFGRTTRECASTFYVRDDGVGFNMGYADKLFGAFQRLHTTAEFPGTGIGLATVQRIIHRHGGRVWAESKPNQGATFYFTLPEPSKELP